MATDTDDDNVQATAVDDQKKNDDDEPLTLDETTTDTAKEAQQRGEKEVDNDDDNDDDENMTAEEEKKSMESLVAAMAFHQLLSPTPNASEDKQEEEDVVGGMKDDSLDDDDDAREKFHNDGPADDDHKREAAASEVSPPTADASPATEAAAATEAQHSRPTTTAAPRRNLRHNGNSMATNIRDYGVYIFRSIRKPQKKKKQQQHAHHAKPNPDEGLLVLSARHVTHGDDEKAHRLHEEGQKQHPPHHHHDDSDKHHHKHHHHEGHHHKHHHHHRGEKHHYHHHHSDSKDGHHHHHRDKDDGKSSALASAGAAAAVETLALREESGDARESTVRFALPEPTDTKQEEHDHALALQMQQKEERRLEKRRAPRPRHRSFRQASAHLARSLRSGMSVRNMKQYSRYVMESTRQSLREIHELDKKNPWRVRIRRIIWAILLGGIAIGCLYWFAILGEDVPDDAIKDFINENILSPQEYAQADPYNARLNPQDADTWETGGNKEGLSLPVINALEAKWDPYFDQAVRDWDNGYPDALNLTASTEVRDPTGNCSAVTGHVKVCNGDYGSTGWRGINNVLLINGFIVSSTARMNEFYTGNPATDDDEMQYVMCHELGHAWGLLHTDESFDNADLGNCMDYTNNERANRQPDETNFQFLFALYGLLPGAAPYTAPPTVAPSVAPAARRRRKRRRDLAGGLPEVDNTPPPPKLLETARGPTTTTTMQKSSVLQETDDWWMLQQLMALQGPEDGVPSLLQPEKKRQLRPGGPPPRPSWRLLHRHAHGEAHELAFSLLLRPDSEEATNHYRLQVHKLLAPKKPRHDVLT